MVDKRSNILVGWKAIAGYLGCSVRVARRKVRRYGLPVALDEDGRARALRNDIDAWVRERVQNGIKKVLKKH